MASDEFFGWDYADRTVHIVFPPNDGDDDDDDSDLDIRRICRLSLDTSDGDDADGSDGDKNPSSAPVTPPGPRRGRRVERDGWVEREWERRRRRAAAGGGGGGEDGECRLLVRTRSPRPRRFCMDLEEVKACCDLGIGIPSDWKVEIPGGGWSAVEVSGSGGESPMADWKISSPGDDPAEVKARLRLWAQAVALDSASRLSSGC